MAASQAIVSGLSGRYAVALFELALAQNALEQVANDLESLRVALGDSDDLRRLIASPLINRRQLEAAMGALAKAASFSELTRNFLGVLAQNRRMGELADMIADFEALLAEHRGEATAQVRAAHQLSEAQISAIRDVLNQKLERKVTVDFAVDKSLLGGLIVRLGSRQIDSSIKTKLNQLRVAMKGAG